MNETQHTVTERFSLGLSGFLSVLTVLLSACGNQEYYPLPEISCRVLVKDSIGVELGEDEYMFAYVISVAVLPDGRILLVDRYKQSVFVYSAEGEFLRTIGREGEGPGDFNRPSQVEVCPDGGIIVECRNGLSVFDSNFNFVERYNTGESTSFNLRDVCDDGTIAGVQSEYKPSDRGINIQTSIGRWKLGESEPEIIYHTDETEFNPEFSGTMDFSDNWEDRITSCWSRDGRYFYSLESSGRDRLEIHCCSPDGAEYFLIEDDTLHRVRKTEEELDFETENVIGAVNAIRQDNSGPDPEIILDLYRYIVESMFVDGENRLWVEMGIYRGKVFRVYDLEGNYLFNAMVDYPGNWLTLNCWTIEADENGILAMTDLNGYSQKVYLLELADSI